MNDNSNKISEDEYYLQKYEAAKEEERDYENEARRDSIVPNPFLPKRWKKSSKR
jgi:hypothetical protein